MGRKKISRKKLLDELNKKIKIALANGFAIRLLETQGYEVFKLADLTYVLSAYANKPILIYNPKSLAVLGNTYPIKEWLKKLGFKWDYYQRAWIYRFE